MFVEFATESGHDTIININHITHIEEIPGGYCYVNLVSGKYIQLYYDIKDVYAKIKDIQNK